MNTMEPTVKPEKKLAEQKTTAAQKYRALIEEANKHKETAVNELRAEIQDKIVELNEFGFSFRLAEGGEISGGRKRATTKRERDPNSPCKICNFVTNPPHDARLKAHRDQGETKKPLTNKQLEEAGLTKVA